MLLNRSLAGRALLSVVMVWLTAIVSVAQGSNQSGSVERGVMVREAQIYLAPSSDSAKLAIIGRGREVAVLEHGAKPWLHVLATVREAGERNGEEIPEKTVTGWMIDKGVVRASMPNGDRILFGEASASELQASRRGGRRGADQDAFRLYYRTYEYFPKSEVAGEALFRAADVRWQLDRAEALARPSAREAKPIGDNEGIPEELMKQVKKKFPGTKWAALADFDMLDNKLCGDWQAQSKCPEREAKLYEDYAREYPQSPRVQEALYQAARRWAALIQIYVTEGQKSKSDDSRQRALDLAQRSIAVDPTADWGMRAQDLHYQVLQEIPLLGNVIE